MNALNRYGLAFLFAASTVAGCATTGTPVSKNDEDEVAAKNENAPKPPSDDKIQAAKQQQAQKPAAQQPKISAAAKADFDTAVKKWDAAQKVKGGMTPGDCKSLASNFSHISEPALAANPAYGPAMANLGGLYYKQNNPATAKSWFEKAVEADPAHSGAAFANL